MHLRLPQKSLFLFLPSSLVLANQEDTLLPAFLTRKEKEESKIFFFPMQEAT